MSFKRLLIRLSTRETRLHFTEKYERNVRKYFLNKTSQRPSKQIHFIYIFNRPKSDQLDYKFLLLI